MNRVIISNGNNQRFGIALISDAPLQDVFSSFPANSGTAQESDIDNCWVFLVFWPLETSLTNLWLPCL